MGLFTYDVTLEQVNMPDVDSMPPTPVRSSWAETDINDSRRPSIAGQRQLQQVGKDSAFITCAHLFNGEGLADLGKDSMVEIAASCLLRCPSSQGHATLPFLKRCNPLRPFHMHCCMSPGQTALMQHAVLPFLKRCNPWCPFHMHCRMSPAQTASTQH